MDTDKIHKDKMKDLCDKRKHLMKLFGSLRAELKEALNTLLQNQKGQQAPGLGQELPDFLLGFLFLGVGPKQGATSVLEERTEAPKSWDTYNSFPPKWKISHLTSFTSRD